MKDDRIEKTRGMIVLQWVLVLLFVFYLAGLIKIVLLKQLSPAQLFLQHHSFKSFNLVPFTSIRLYQHIAGKIGFLRWAGGTFGNLIIFIPMGWFIPLLVRSRRPILLVLTISALLSLGFEITQYLTGTGSADIDDIILNIAGGMLGYLVYILLQAFIGTGTALRLGMIILFLAFLAGASVVIYKEYGFTLGLVRTKFITVGGNGIPARKPDIFGQFSRLSHDSLFFEAFPLTSGIAEADSHPEKNRDFVMLTPGTKIFRLTSDYKDYVVTDSMHESFPAALSSIEPGLATIRVWRNTSGDQELAATVVFYLLTNNSGEKRSSVRFAGNKSNPSHNHPDYKQALEMVSDKNLFPTMSGRILEIRHDTVIIDKIITKVLANGSSLSFGTARGSKNFNKARLIISPSTIYFSKQVINGGKSPSVVKHISPGHLKPGDFLNVYGPEKDKLVNAEILSIVNF